jgi:hypothetical protein
MPGPAPDPRVFAMADPGQLTARAALPRERRERIRAVAAVTGFGITSYAAGVLTDWAAAPMIPCGGWCSPPRTCWTRQSPAAS